MKKNKGNNINIVDESIINWELHHMMRSKQMNKQILRLKLGSLKIKFVFRHRFEKYRTLSDRSEWRNWELGVWFRKSRLVGTMKKGKGAFGSDNLVPEYMLGLNLLVIKLWVTVSRNALEFPG